MEKEKGFNEKWVQLIAVDPRYRKDRYPAVAIYSDTLNTYLTGQHIDPSRKETYDNLTIDEMTGEVPLSVSKMKRFPYVINPDNTVPLIHLRKINLSRHVDGSYAVPGDKAFYDFLMFQPVVASSKEKVIRKKHFFYIMDAEAEAESRVTRRDKVFNALKKVRENTSVRNYEDIALFLNYNIQEMKIPVGILSKTQLEDKVMDACEKYPDEVLRSFAPDSAKVLYILKLVRYKIISRNKDGNFYDGTMYLGRTIEEVISFMNQGENEAFVTKWQKIYLQKENLIPQDVLQSDEVNTDDIKQEAIQGYKQQELARKGKFKKKLMSNDEDTLKEEAEKIGIDEKTFQGLLSVGGKEMVIDFMLNKL